MLTIDRLKLQLPAHFQARAKEIVRLTTQELASLPLTANLHLERLTLPPIRVAATAATGDVARAIATAIGTALQKQLR